MTIAKPKETLSAGGVVVSPGGRVLVVSQHGTSWSLPKGHLDPGETALEAARREIAEEGGVEDLELVTELGTYTRYKIGRDGGDNKNERKTITMFLFRCPEEIEPAPRDPHNPEARWVEPDEVEPLLTHAKDRLFFAAIRHRIKEAAD